jgi:hypothetical protein
MPQFHHRPPERMDARRQQKWLDAQIRKKTDVAMKVFEQHRVPGVAYDVSSVVGAEGQLILTWTPRGRV